MDPFLELIQLLRPRATLWRQIEAAGLWAISFPRKNDLLFCSVVHGDCLLVVANAKPIKLSQGDFVLIRTSESFRFASDTRVKPADSEKAFSPSSSNLLKLGSGKARSVLLHGGRFLFDTANENLLTAMLPPLIQIAANTERSERVRALLQMNASEAAATQPGRGFVIARLMELLFVEILRDQSRHAGEGDVGLFAGLADPVIARALQLIHGNIAQDWTVAGLAQKSGISRSRFASRFHDRLGVSPIRYLLDWRMAVAKDQLRKGTHSISEIAFAVGYKSVSAFSTAFHRTVGSSPRRYAESCSDSYL